MLVALAGHATGQGTARRGRERRESFLCTGAGRAKAEGKGKSPWGCSSRGTLQQHPSGGAERRLRRAFRRKKKREEAGG